jgi:hypothetical protein
LPAFVAPDTPTGADRRMLNTTEKTWRKSSPRRNPPTAFVAPELLRTHDQKEDHDT